MGQLSPKYFLILCIIHTSLAASRFRVEKYTVTFDEDLDSDKQEQSEGDANNAVGKINFIVPQFTGRITSLKSRLNPFNDQLFQVFQPITDAVPFPRRNLRLNPQWVRGSHGEIATFAYHAGYLHKDNFVARAVYNNSLIPGKIISGQEQAYIGVGTKEIGVSSYENGFVFRHAVFANVFLILVDGMSSKMGVVGHEFFDGISEIAIILTCDYQTLGSSPSNLCWTTTDFLSTAKPVEGGHDENGNPIHVGRTSDQEILGAFYPSRGELVTTSNGRANVEKNLKNIEILVWSWSAYPNCWW
ncbi:hypothetical protein Fcan01_10877 [Folsomia candida]|uniref:Uncharacterized protein n=1 Tax=Folsomia candida TaxID=158441 RepID=A0A226ECM0_FOLCA|nr:hypothetical protein Fcan01_10877 [Folsomia candida]